MPARTPAADPSPSAAEKVTLWIEKTIWKACVATSPCRVESAIRIEKPASSSPDAKAGIAPNASSRIAPRKVSSRNSAVSACTPRAAARGKVHAAASMPMPPSAEAISVASAAPTAPSAGSPRCPPDSAQASSALTGRIDRLTAATRRGRLTPSRKKLAVTIISWNG